MNTAANTPEEIARAAELGVVPGAVLKFREVLEAGDETARFDFVELRGTRVLVSVRGWHNPNLTPTAVYDVEELEPTNGN